ncbi:MAG: putative zinc-containing alcohol dehydrogenase [Actinomycetia bacterium]|nr:putative zinc-containing alcohol dehydrogenase [Actinomycetes bacterium]
MKTRAAVLRAIKTPWSVEDVELDEPREHEVLVRVAAAGLCHSDDHPVQGDMPANLPLIGGHEGAGVVEAVGSSVTRVAVGDHVAFSFLPECGECAPCLAGRPESCLLQIEEGTGLQLQDATARHHAAGDGEELRLWCSLGTFSEHTVVHELQVIKFADDVPFAAAALVSCGVGTGFGAATRSSQVQAGDTAVVVGLGGLGMSAVQGFRHAGAAHIIGVDPVTTKHELAQKLGATHTVASIEEANEVIAGLTDGRMAERAVITIGGPGSGTLLASIMALVGRRGRVVMASISPVAQIDVKLSLIDLTMGEKELVGSIYGHGSAEKDVPALLELYRSGDLDLDSLITARYSLDEINEGYAAMHAGSNIRGVIEMP